MKAKGKVKRKLPQKILSKISWSGDVSLIFFFLAVIGTFIFEIFLVVKSIYPPESIWPKIHCSIGIYFLHNIIGNFIMIIRHESTIRGKMMLNSYPTSLNRVCITCETSSPPRSYHCTVCNVCVLKRDHHCKFANTCIGYFNYRYFFPLLLYLIIGSAYTSFLNMNFIWILLGGFNGMNLLAHSFPFIFWMLGKLTIYQTICCIISVLNIATCFFSLFLFYYYGSMMLSNQTVHERAHRIDIYDLKDVKANIEQSLGINWMFIWISPLVPSKMLGNGQEFPTRKDYRLNSHKNR